MTTPTLAEAPVAEKLGLRHKFLLNTKDAPLIYLVHGRAGNLDVMWSFRRCVPTNWNVIAPEAPTSDPIGGYSWWRVGEDIPKSETKENARWAAEKLYSFTQNSIAHYNLSPKFIVALGFSQGAGLLSTLLQLRPELFRGVGILAGFTVKLEDSLKFPGIPPQIFWAHGSKDETIPLERAERGQQFLSSLGLKVESVVDPVGHKVGTSGMKALSAWLRNLEL